MASIDATPNSKAAALLENVRCTPRCTLTDETTWRSWIRSHIQRAHPLLWVIENSLACAPRPLRYHTEFGGRVPSLPPDAAPALHAWLDALNDHGVGTIVVLATRGELRRYAAVTAPAADLLRVYESRGFRVHHHPVEDPAHAAASARAGIRDQIEALKPVILTEYVTRAGAMLIHCSGGMDRTAPIAAFVAHHIVGRCPFT